ncbi:MAG: imidazolonepropionase [Anaerolineae bacterium]|nr:imidazolonepropionase [Anaerolineae bacterium]
MKVDLLIRNARQLLTIVSPDGPKIGSAMSDLGLIEDGALAIKDGRIALVGKSSEVRAQAEARKEVDASGRVVMPGFVDPHTHFVFAGSRVDEFEMRLRGATYLEIMAAGGGIMSTVRATRQAGIEELLAQSRQRLDRMLSYGTTTAEVKTGYGLNVAQELKMVKAIKSLDESHPVDLVATFLGAHATPQEYKGRSEEYMDMVVEEMLPEAAKEGACFCDVFCDEGAFTLAQSRRLLEAAKALGMGLKIHADEFKTLGGAALAAELGATSADHLICTPEEELRLLATAGTVAVLLPGTPFGLGEEHYAPARRMIELGLPVSLGTDLNPGTCFCESMQFVIALAARKMGTTSAEAVVASTLNAAYALGRGAEIGSLEVGKKADILILDTSDYRDLAYRFGGNLVARVFKGGQPVWPKEAF